MEVQQNIMRGFRILKRENTRDNIIRILFEQIDYILEQSEKGEDEFHKSIHEIRKSIKRIRAVLRLIREEVGYSTYHRENVFYRDINRETSDLRTYNVLTLTLEELSSHLSAKIPAEDIEPLSRSIRDERDKLQSRLLSRENLLKNLSNEFREARKRIPDLPIEHEGFDVFYGGLFRIYRQGKSYLKSSIKKTDSHHLHDMRKRMKYLWYHVEILRPIYPGPLRAYANSLENISMKLGVYHDLDILGEYLQKNEPVIKEQIHQNLLDACDFKKAALLPGIMRMSEAAYIDEPEAFVNRMGEYWKIFYRQA
jgi:CHAD domain-containing protein